MGNGQERLGTGAERAPAAERGMALHPHTAASLARSAPFQAVKYIVKYKCVLR
jgi:hypothetical protein